MNVNWRQAPLIDFAELVSTGPFGSMLHKSDYVSDGVPLINPTNIVGEEIEPDADKQVGEEALARLGSYVLMEDDVVVGRRGEIGRCAVVGPAESGWVCGTGCFFVRPRPDLDARFLAHLLRSPLYREQLERASTGATMKNMSNTALAQLSVSVPSRDEQRRIVAILDEAFEGIATAKANAEKNLQNAREVFKNHLDSVFSAVDGDWTTSPVGLVADCCLGKMLDRSKNKGELKPYLRNLNVRWFELDLSDVQEMRFTPEETERYSVRFGDVVICEGGYPGRAAIWDQKDAIFFQKALHRVRFANPALARWFLYFLYSQETSGKLRRYFTGTGIQHFTGAALSRLVLPIPPSHKVDEFVEGFDAVAREVSHLEAIYQRKLAALDELKKSLLHQAFSGQL